MNHRNTTAALLRTAAALAPGFVFATPAPAQEQTKEKSGRKGQTMTLDQLPQPVQQTINQEAKRRSTTSASMTTAR